jgi:hypothetical protein
MGKKLSSYLFAAILLGSILSAGVGQAQLVLYDDFNAVPPVINPDKWHGTEAAGTTAAPTLETIRKIVAKKLQLSLVFHGDTASNVGGPSAGLQRLRFNNPNAITAIQAKVVVQKAEAQACLANPASAKARAQISGRFFNDGTGAGANETGDFFAGIEMQLDSDPAVGRRIRSFVNRCTNSDCSSFTNIDSQTFLTPWSVGGARTLLIQWDPASDQFITVVNPGTAAAETLLLSYAGFADANAPIEQSKELRVNGDPVNCVAARMRTTTTAVFDNVFTN